MAKYMTAVLGSHNGLQRADLSGVTCFRPDELDTLIAKFNFAASALRNKGMMDAEKSYVTEMGIRNTDVLTKLLNEPVRSPNTPLAHDVTKLLCKGPQVLMHLIDHMWLRWIRLVPPNNIKHYRQMEDPDVDGGPQGQMISSGGSRGFKTTGIGFRGDTRSYDEFDELGFTARYSLPPGHRFHVPEAYGTVAARWMAFDRVGNDFLNQTGVCVARNLLGSMKFIGGYNDKDVVLTRRGHLFAVQFDTGVDTERMQLDNILSQEGVKNRTVLWRAGEKAARGIPKRNFLASCEFEVDDPYHTDRNPVFNFRRLSDWKFHNATATARDYVQASIANIDLNTWYPFTRAHDWAA